MRRVARAKPVLNPDRVLTEHEEQRNLVRWFRQTHGLLTNGAVRIFAIPNGSQRSRTTGARLKEIGRAHV